MAKEQYSKSDIDKLFSKVISMVEDGWDISKAIKKIGYCKTSFYNKITPQQKALLDIAKTLNTKYGVGSKYSKEFNSYSPIW